MTVKKTQQTLSTTLEKTEQSLNGIETALENNVGGRSRATEENIGLPEGWVLSALDILANRLHQGINTSADKVKYVDEGMKILQAKHITSGVVNYVGAKELGDADVEKYVDRYKPLKNHILFTNIGTIGRSIVLKQDADYLIAWNIFLISASTSINPQLLKQYLDFLRLSGFYETLYRGGATQFINKKQLSALRIPLPPLAEQTVIAQTLDTLLAQVDNIKTRLDAIPNILKTFRQSVLAAAVSGKLTEAWRGENECLYPSKEELDKNIRIARKIKWEEQQLASFDRKGTKPKNDGWKKRYKQPLDGFMDEYSMTQIQAIPDEWLKSNLDTVSITVTGKTPSTTKEENWNGNLPFISPSQVSKNGEILSSERMVSDLGAMNTPVLPANSILIVCIGTIGKVGLLDREAAFNQQLNALIPVDGMNTMFLYYWSKTLYDWLIKTSSAVVNAAIINKSRLSSAPCPLPSLEEQTQIVHRVEELFAFADQIEQQVQTAQGRVNNLTQSILAKAFRGELTAQWRAENPDLISGDNSAEALLAKIQAEREKLKPKKATKKKSTAKKTTRKKAAGKPK